MITVNYQNQTVTIPATGTLLESLEQSSVPVESHCRDGYCGACRCKLKSGDVKYTNSPIAFVSSGEVLTCCAIPVSNIEIEVL